ncbi:Uu.00g125320.m01.CDS01 [Anthostomella pinea]|uniref:Uu.00g125320.m01.CDS01 n=1 Tax=Anthostomella pinea TaxID=933095 RepID=A0AAI8VHN5_9PEZI|nr:Uu.00g125320.m01.CDS01 [Anthostomella pinea]
MAEPGYRHRDRGLERNDERGERSDDSFPGRASKTNDKRSRDDDPDTDERRARRRYAYGDGDGRRKRRRSESPRRREERERYDGHRRRDDGNTTERRRDREEGRDDSKILDDRDARDHASRSTRRTHHRDDNDNHDRNHKHKHHHHRHHAHHRSPTRVQKPTPTTLPCDARPLSRTADYGTFRPLLARYLDVQKQKDITALDEREVRGRWKSFVGKWNAGELAEGWYHAELFQEAVLEWKELGLDRAMEEAEAERGRGHGRLGSGDGEKRGVDEVLGGEVLGGGIVAGEDVDGAGEGHGGDDEDDDDDYGPILPDQATTSSSGTQHPQTRHGPGIPNLQDLSLQREAHTESTLEARDRLRLDRKADRATQKERLEDLAPRAEPGTRERQLEKKREVNEKMKGFREKSPGGEINDAELLGGGGGGGGDSLEEYKRMKEADQRKKTEREVRREEVQRARAAEREERVREYREKEEGTLAVLKEIARHRFG